MCCIAPQSQELPLSAWPPAERSPWLRRLVARSTPRRRRASTELIHGFLGSCLLAFCSVLLSSGVTKHDRLKWFFISADRLLESRSALVVTVLYRKVLAHARADSGDFDGETPCIEKKDSKNVTTAGHQNGRESTLWGVNRESVGVAVCSL